MINIIKPKKVLASATTNSTANFMIHPAGWDNISIASKGKVTYSGVFVVTASMEVVKGKQKLTVHGYDFDIDESKTYQVHVKCGIGIEPEFSERLAKLMKFDSAELYAIFAANLDLVLKNLSIQNAMELIVNFEDDEWLFNSGEIWYSESIAELTYQTAGKEKIFTPEIEQIMALVDKCLPMFSVMNLAFLGPTGNGKTTAAKIIADSLGFGFWRENVALLADTEQLFGGMVARQGSTFFEESLFTEKLRQGNMVILLDEANRVPPDILNSILPLLDDDKRTIVRGHEIVVAPNTLIILSMNIGHQYSGTFSADAALMNRCDGYQQFEFPKENTLLAALVELGLEEMEARDYIRKIDELRTIDLPIEISFRMVLRIAKMVISGVSHCD